MDSLYQDTLDYLRKVAKTTPSLLATQEEVTYFTPKVMKTKKEPAKAPPPALIPQKIAEPAIQIVPPTPLPEIKKRNTNDMRQTIEKTFPGYALRETTPDDTHAKKMSRLWEETYLSAQIIVIAFGEIGSGLEFLKNVTRAIDTLIAPAQLVEGSHLEKTHGWDLLLNSPTLKHALLSPWSTWKSTSLNNHYRQNGSTQEQFLGPHKLLLLEPSSAYLKNPDHKRKLWQLINTQLLS